MKKRFLCLALALLFCLGLLPGMNLTASAEDVGAPTVPYDLWIAGVQVTSKNAEDLSVIEGVDGTASYDPDTNTLTLEDAVIQGNAENTIAVRTANLTIAFSGTSTISARDSTGYCRGIDAYQYGNLTLAGEEDATLTVETTHNISPENGAIRGDSVTVTGGTVIAECPEAAYGSPVHIPYALSLNAGSDALVVTGGKVIARGWAPLAFRVNADTIGDATVLKGSASYDGSGLEPYDYGTNGGFTDSGWQNNYRYVTAEKGTSAAAYDLWIAGTRVTSKNAEDLSVIEGVDGTASYDPATNTLTLEDAAITGCPEPGTVFSDNVGIYYTGSDDLTISLEGSNSVTTARITATGGSVYSSTFGVLSQHEGTAVLFSGTGSLTAKAGESKASRYASNAGIMISGPATIDAGTTVTATADGSYSSGGIYVYGLFTVNGTLTAAGGPASSQSYGIRGNSNITVGGEAVVNASGGDATATNGASSCGISCSDYDTGVLTVVGNAKVTAVAGTAESGQSYGIRAHAVKAGETAAIAAVGGKAIRSSSGITTLSHGIDAYTLEISDSAEVTATGGEVIGGESSYGVNLSEKATISGGSLTAVGVGGDSCEYSRGLATVVKIGGGYGLYISGGTVSLTGGLVTSYGFGYAGGDLEITGGALTAKTDAAMGSAIKPNAIYNVTVAPVMASTSADGSDPVIYHADDNADYKWYKAPAPVYTVTVESGSGSGSYTEGETVEITADEAPEGKVFAEWTSGDGVTFADASAAETTFPMPAKDVTVTAAYKDAEPEPEPEPEDDDEPEYLSVTVAESEHGTVVVDPTEVSWGEQVTIKIVPDEGYEIDTVSVGPAGGRELAVTENEDGVFSFIQPFDDVLVTVTYRETEKPFVNPFTDVSEDAYYYDAVTWAARNGVADGITEDTFGPDTDCTRAQMVTFLWRIAGRPEPASAEKPFTDLDESAYYFKAVLWAYEEGVALGVGEGRFDPDSTVSRGQAVTFLFRALGGTAGSGEPFEDVAPGAFYYDAVTWAYGNGVTLGTGSTAFSPDDDCTRAQIAAFLYRAYGEG